MVDDRIDGGGGGAYYILCSLKKQPTFDDATSGLRKERRNSILMKRHYPDLGSASDWLKQMSHSARPIGSTRHHYGISALVSQTSVRQETSGGVAECRLFSQIISCVAGTKSGGGGEGKTKGKRRRERLQNIT